MAQKVHELAKELNMASKELLERIHGMGIEAKSHMSVLSDMDVLSIKNRIKNSTGHAETKIVKVAAKKTESKDDGEVRVQIKPAAKAVIAAQERAQSKTAAQAPGAQQTQGKATGAQAGLTAAQRQARESASGYYRTPPQGKPMPKTVVAPNGKVMPQGKPMPKNAVPQNKTAPENPEAEAGAGIAAADGKAAGAKAADMKAADVKAAETVRTAGTASDAQAAGGAAKTAGVSGAQAPEKSAVENGARAEAKLAETKAAADKKTAAAEQAKTPAAASKQTEQRPGPAARVQTEQNRPRTESRRDGAQGSAPWRDGEKKRDGSFGGRRDKPAGKRDDRGGYAGSRSSQESGRGGKKNFGREAAGAADLFGKPQSHKKQNDRDRKEKREKQQYGKPMDLTKSAPKKHKKYKEKAAEQVEESNIELEALPSGTKIVNVPITVKGLAEQIEKTTSQIIMALMKLGVMANINQNLDEDTVVLLGDELGVNIVVDKVAEEIVEEGLELFEDKESDLKPRPPIITVMGHVDHGKTSLLDAIRKTNVTDREAGGITQHIGASEVVLKGQKIVFLDTPGHEAFTAMRARGAHATDIAVLVVAADDSVKPQTVESISHAKAAGVPIIVAINKMDKPGANPDRVKQDLTEYGIVVEDWGGDTIAVPVSAKTGDGIVNLLEMILLQAEMLELKANPNRLAMGTVIEARLDKAKGPVATLLVLNGTLQSGMSVVAGTCSGRIRAMTNYKGDTIRKAGPATAVEILGLTEVPEAGDKFYAVREDKVARDIAERRKTKLREEVMAKNASVTLEQLFSQIEEGEVKELNLILKADVQGSVGALTTSLEKLQNENVKVKIIHSGVGTVTESDIMLASTSGAIIIGFNVRPTTAVSTMAEREGVEIRTYSIIYEAIEDIESALVGMLDPEFKEVVMGKIEIRDTFKVPGVGTVGGAYVLEGKVARNAQIRLVRDGIVIHEGKISSLKRFKDDVKEVNTGYECGIGIENYNDIKEGDIIEAFKMEEIERKR